MSEEIPYDVVEDFYEIIESPVVTEELDNTDVDSSIQVLDFTGGLGSLVKSSSNSEEAIDVEDEEIVSEDSNEVIEVEEVEDLDSTVKELQEQVAERFWENNAIYENMAQVQNEALLMVDDIEAAHTLASEATVAAQDAHNEAVVASGAASAAQTAADQAAIDALAAAGLANNVATRGSDLVTNGNGQLGNNTNFSAFTYSTDAPTGIVGSFLSETFGTFSNGEFISIDPGKSYIQSVYMRQTVPGIVSRAYVGLVACDAQKQEIYPHSYVYGDRTMTTLAQPLNPGDTEVHLTSVPSGDEWTRLPSARWIGFWDWVDPAGKKWPAGTYTRRFRTFSSINGNVVTLTTPYNDVALPAGNPVSRNYPGGSYMYTTISNLVASESWTRYESKPITGVFNGVSEGTNQAALSFPPGTAYVKLLFLSNRNDVGTAAPGSKQAFAGLSLSDAAGALAAANSKADVLIQSTAPAVEMRKSSTLWIDTTGGANTPKRWNGTAWIAVTDKAATDAANAAAAAQIAANNAIAQAQAAQDEAEDALAAAAAANTLAAGKITTFYQSTTPTATTVGDLWLNTSITPNQFRRWSGSAWVDVTDSILQKALTAAGDAQATADGKVRTFAQNDAPTGMVAGDAGDLWIDTNDGNKMYRWSGTAWVAVQDASIAAAQSAADAASAAAAAAAGVAGGKADVIIQSATPAASMQKSSTLWIDTTGGNNTPKRWSGSAWVAITDKAAVDAANAAANAAAAAATAQAAADAAQTTANNAQNAAGTAQTTANTALTSANGRNSRTISTSAPSGVNNVSTGNPNVEGDTWWRWDNTTSRNVIGQWVWRSGSWVAEMIGHQTISSMDVNKLVVTGSAKMSQVVVEKIVGDSAYFGLLTADKFQSIPLSIYFDGTFLGADLTALRAANSGYTAGAGTLTGNSTIWLTHTAVDSAASSNLTKDIKYRIRVTATGLTSAYSMAINQTSGYAFIGETTLGDGYIECYVTPSSDDARVALNADSGAPTITISRIEIMPMTGATIIEPGSIGTIHLAADSITADKVLIGTGNNRLVGGPSSKWFFVPAGGASEAGRLPGDASQPERIQINLGTTSSGFANRAFFGLSASVGAVYGSGVNLIPVIPGTAYTARMNVRTVGTQTVRPSAAVGIYFYSNLDFANSLLGVWGSYVATTNVFQEYSKTVVAPAGAVWAMVALRSDAPDVPADRAMQFTAPYFGEAVDGSLIVDGAIDGKTINGANIYSPNSTALPRVHVGGSQVRVIRSDGEGGETVTTQLGGSTRDQIALYDTSGDLISGLMSNGSATIGGELSTESLLVGGDNVIDLIDARPKGVISIMKATADSDKAGTGQLGYVMLRGDTSTNRVYRVSVRGMMAVMTAGDTAQVIIQTFEPSSKVLQIGNYTIPKTTAEHISLETTFRGLVDGSARFGILFRNATANRGVFWSGRTNYPVEVVLEDLGSVFYNSNGATATFDRMGGTPLTAGSNTDETGTTTYTKTYSSSWTRSWRGSGTVSDYLHHGYYGGYQRYSMVGFPAAVTTDLSGATIKKVEIYLANQSWWGSSGTAYIGKSTATSAPANPQTSGGSAFTVTNWAQGAKKWVTAPSGWWASNTRAITLGEGAGTSTTAYGKFATAGVKLRITYEK